MVAPDCLLSWTSVLCSYTRGFTFMVGWAGVPSSVRPLQVAASISAGPSASSSSAAGSVHSVAAVTCAACTSASKLRLIMGNQRQETSSQAQAALDTDRLAVIHTSAPGGSGFFLFPRFFFRCTSIRSPADAVVRPDQYIFQSTSGYTCESVLGLKRPGLTFVCRRSSSDRCNVGV